MVIVLNNENAKDMLALPYYEEVWRDTIVNKYQMSTFGRIRKLIKYVNGNIKYHYRYIKPELLRCGYYNIKLWENGQYKHYQVHRLVAMTFPELIEWTEGAKGKPIEELEINHKNENKIDNRVENLQWCTTKENNNWGTKPQRLSEKLKGRTFTEEHNRKLSESKKGCIPYNRKPVMELDLDNNLVKIWDCVRLAAEYYNVCPSSIYDAIKGKCKTCVKHKWKYV